MQHFGELQKLHFVRIIRCSSRSRSARLSQRAHRLRLCCTSDGGYTRPTGVLACRYRVSASSEPSLRPASSHSCCCSSSPPHASRDTASSPSSRASHSSARDAASSCSPACCRSRRTASGTAPRWRPRRWHATIPARWLRGGGWVLDERCVGGEEGGIDVRRSGLSGHVSVRVVLRVGRGKVFGAGEGLRCRRLRGGISIAVLQSSTGVSIPLGSRRRKRSCSVRRGSRRSTR